MTLYAKDSDAAYFGGVAGQNKGKITNASNTGNITAEGASYVGGIVGMNGTEKGEQGVGDLTGEIVNEGNVSGKEKVGGIAGINQNSMLLTRDEENKLTLSNAGAVKATDGGAGGIFYENKDGMNWVELVNSGTVDGGSHPNTGGIFGLNSGSAENSTFTNSGTVSGAGNVGGLFGSNSGTFTKSSLTSGVGAKVEGSGDNVGGLIGYNTGTIEGGRTDADGTDAGYYKYKVYNNGEVIGKANVGGLIGYNAAGGTLYAGYNTGTVTATVNNAGGIAGHNKGTVSTVFNTIMTLDANKNIVTGSVTGATNVGGLIGMNSGTLSDAYNTTGVTGTSATGNAVGSNAGKITNVYATNADGKLIGDNTAEAEKVTNVYTFAADDDSAVKITDDQHKQSTSYSGFDFNGTGDIEAAWKNYDGLSTPMLKVFLTEAEYDSSKENFIYNAGEQHANAGYITMADDTAYNNVSGLLSPTTGNKDAGTYMAFYSDQIAASVEGDVFNPNNLGYDIDATYSIGKATIDVELKDVWRVYGNEQMYGDEALQNKLDDYSELYSLKAAGDTGTELNDAMRAELNDGITLKELNDQAVDNLQIAHRTTNDAGDYAWTAEVQLGDGLTNNYQIEAPGTGSAILTGAGKSHVKKADLNIVLSNVSREYGTAQLSEGYEYKIVKDKTTGVTNGDILSLNEPYTVAADEDGAIYLDAAAGEIRTNNVGDYKWTVTKDDYKNAFVGINTDNYNITVTPGESKVTPKTLSISSVLATIVYGKQDGNDFVVSDGSGELQGVVYNDDISLNVDLKAIKDENLTGAYAQNKGERDTADAGIYTDSLTFSGLSLAGDDSKVGNYTLNDEIGGTIEVTPAELTITLKDVERIYGNTSIKNGGYSVANATLTNGDSGLEGFTVDRAFINDLGLLDDMTADAGEYKWNVTDLAAFNGFVQNLSKNYDFTLEDVTAGGSIVKQRALYVNDILGTIQYGSTGDFVLEHEIGFKAIDEYNETGLLDGDSVSLAYDAVTAKEGGEYALNRGNDRATADVKWTNGEIGVYENSLKTSVSLKEGDDAKNYYLADADGDGRAIVTGDIKVTPAPLTIKLNDVERIYGDTTITEGGYNFSFVSGTDLVNGDTNLKLGGAAADGGLVENGTKTANTGEYTWTADINNFSGADLNNYDVKYEGGKSVVTPKKLSISSVLATIVYGDQNGKGLTVDEEASLAEGSIVYGDDISLGGTATYRYVTNSRYDDNKGTRTTADAGFYSDSLSVTGLTLTGDADKLGNYKLDTEGAIGDIKVTKAELTLTPDDATTVYGTAFDETSYSYTLSGVANGDSTEELKNAIGKLEYANSAAVEGQGTKYTLDANEEGYEDAISITGLDKLTLANYTLEHGDKGTAVVKKAPLTITLNDVEHNYGAVLDSDAIGYGIKSANGLVNGDDSARLTFNAETAKNRDTALYRADGGEWRTYNADGGYDYLTDIAQAFDGGLNLANYNVTYEGGKSVVTPKELSISSILATIVYGDQGGAGFKVAGGGDLTGVVYGDEVYFSKELKIEDAAFAAGGDYEKGRNGRVTADAGESYAQGLTFSNVQLSGRHAGNYFVDGNVDASITVTPAQLSVAAHDKLTRVGREPEYTGTTFEELNGSLVNGDVLSGFVHTFGIEEAEMLNNAGRYPNKIGAVVNGLYYYDGTHDWSGHHDVFANYDVNVDAGSLRVFVPAADYPINYGWLYDDAPYSRKRNFRERKAEIYFQDGGMEYDENM